MPPRPRTPAASTASLPPALLARLQSDVEGKLRKRIGIRPADATPAALKALINQEIGTVATPLLKGKVNAEVQSTMAGLAQARTIDKFKENLGFAQAGISVIAAASEVDEILKKRAELLFKKKTALETAGFTPDQAMQIVLGDIAAKAH